MSISANSPPLISLLFDAFEYPVDAEEPNRFVQHRKGAVVALSDDDEDIVIGNFSAIYVDVDGAAAEEESIFDVFDSYQHTIGYYEGLYEEGSIRERVRKLAQATDFFASDSLLILDRLTIFPAYRGRGLGLTALHGIITSMKMGAGLIAMKPFPLQLEAHNRDEHDLAERQALRLDGFTSDAKKATAKLRSYYERLGFVKVPRTDFMVRSATAPLPDLVDIQEQLSV